MDNVLDQLRSEAEQAERLLGARERYQQALAEQKRQEETVKNQTVVEELQAVLDSKSESFKTHLAEVSTELTAILSRLTLLENKFIELGKEADLVMGVSLALSRAECRAGWHTEKAKAQGLTGFDQAFYESLSASKIISRFGIQNPLTFRYGNLPLSELALYVLSAPFWTKIKMQFIGQALPVQPQPEIVESPVQRANNGNIKPIESKDKLISIDQFKQLWNTPH